MKKNIWQKLQKTKQPFFVLAPMDDVTDTVFRQMVTTYAPADLMMTEFANTDGWCSEGRSAVTKRLKHTAKERPLIAQIWGSNPTHFKKMSQAITKLDFDGIDINMGCPINSIIKDGSCSALIQNPTLATEIIQATQEGVSGKIPVSVKTRIGYSKVETESWLPTLLSQNLDAITVHGRTKKEKSKVAANWSEIAKSIELRDKIAPNTIIVGNGDVLSLQDGIQKAKTYGVDGVMIGRGIFQNFFVFSRGSNQPKKLPDMLELLKTHVQLHQTTWGEDSSKKFQPLKKFIKMYIHGYSNISKLRTTLMNTTSHAELIAQIDNTINTYK